MNGRYSVYEVTVPIFIRYLTILDSLIHEARSYAKTEAAIEQLLQARLAPDMYTFIQQVQYAYFMALETVVNLTGIEMPKEFKYDEKTAGELERNISQAITVLRSVKRENMDAHMGKQIETFLDPTKTLSADEYVLHLAMPNFFFHVTTAYDILRHQGVPLKKENYLGLT